MYRRRRRKHKLGRVMESSGWGGHNCFRSITFWKLMSFRRRGRENRSFYGEGPMPGCRPRGHVGVGPSVLWRWAVLWLTQNDGKGLTDWFRYLGGGGWGGEERLCFFLVKMASLRRWHAVGRSLLLCSTDTQLPAWLWDTWVLLYAVPPWAAEQRRCARTERVSEEGARGTLLEAVSCLFNEIIFQN